MDKEIKTVEDLILEIKYNKDLRIKLREALNDEEEHTRPKTNVDDYPKMYMRDSWYG